MKKTNAKNASAKKAAPAPKPHVPTPTVDATPPVLVTEGQVEITADDYYPEIAEWRPALPDQSVFNPMAKTFYVHEENEGQEDAPGLLVATIEVNPAFGPAAANRIAWLMSFAPLLWRTLREIAPGALNCIEDLDDFNKAHDLLWEAARRPYDWPKPDNDTDGVYTKRMKMLCGHLVGRKEAASA